VRQIPHSPCRGWSQRHVARIHWFVMASHQNWLTFFRTSLRSFHASESPLRILRTVASKEEFKSTQVQQLMVLDSSFNPPTRAHLHIAASALDAYDSHIRATRLILLLATQNADKPSQPASFEHRLCMMSLLAEDVIKEMKAAGREGNLAVDIGVTTLPYFVGKAKALSSPGNYDHGSDHGKPIQQIHLIGYDTLIRIFNTKYYPPDHTLRPLQDLFDHHRLRVSSRTDSDWGTMQDQTEYLEAIRSGAREAEGARVEWADRIDLVENSTTGEGMVSSTKGRTAAKASGVDKVRDLCPTAVAEYVIREQLYKDD
jgi:nicotinamide-nucleotide adenylyltransferase